jgi:hypothetical protein
MPHSVYFNGRAYAEPHILRNVTPAGPVIGKYADTPVREIVRDEWGRSYRYAGVTVQNRGSFDPTMLRDGEFILPPGIIYRMLDTQRRAAR